VAMQQVSVRIPSAHRGAGFSELDVDDLAHWLAALGVAGDCGLGHYSPLGRSSGQCGRPGDH
jgi:hypothetical protein